MASQASSVTTERRDTGSSSNRHFQSWTLIQKVPQFDPKPVTTGVTLLNTPIGQPDRSFQHWKAQADVPSTQPVLDCTIEVALEVPDQDNGSTITNESAHSVGVTRTLEVSGSSSVNNREQKYTDSSPRRPFRSWKLDQKAQVNPSHSRLIFRT
jgi:hypothetical protein